VFYEELTPMEFEERLKAGSAVTEYTASVLPDTLTQFGELRIFR